MSNHTGKIYRIKTNSISLGQNTWTTGSLISGERLGVLADYFIKLNLIEEAAFKSVDELSQPAGSAPRVAA